MAERWERRLGGLLEGEGGGKQGWLQSQNRAAGCGGHDDAPGGRLRAPCGRPAALQPLSLTLQSKVESEQKKARLSNETAQFAQTNLSTLLDLSLIGPATPPLH